MERNRKSDKKEIKFLKKMLKKQRFNAALSVAAIVITTLMLLIDKYMDGEIRKRDKERSDIAERARRRAAAV